MRLKLKYILIILPILIGASLIFKVNVSQATCGIEELSQLLEESKSCKTKSCFNNLTSRLAACQAEAQKNKNQAAKEAAKFQNRVDNLANSISEKNTSINSLNSEIANLEYEINKLFSEIKAIEKRMKKNKSVVKAAVKNFYEYDKENIITIILAQKSISGFFDEVFYVGSIQERISNIVAQLKKDKKTLNKKKKELANRKEVLEINRASLLSQKNILAKQQAEQNKLFESAENKKAAYARLTSLAVASLSQVRSDYIKKFPPKPGSCSGFPIYAQDGNWGNMNTGCSIAEVGCAVTSTAMVFSYYGKRVTPSQIGQYTINSGGRKCILDWVWAGDEEGFDYKRMSLNTALSRGYPAIIHTDLYGGDYGHYVVAIKDVGNGYLIADPWTGGCRILGKNEARIDQVNVYYPSY